MISKRITCTLHECSTYIDKSEKRKKKEKEILPKPIGHPMKSDILITWCAYIILKITGIVPFSEWKKMIKKNAIFDWIFHWR